MPALKKTLQHPSFGACELVPSVVAIKWAQPMDQRAARAKLGEHSLELAEPKPASKRSKEDIGDARDPRMGQINQSTTLSWAQGSGSADLLKKLEADAAVEWASPAYRAIKAENGPQSWFAFNPKVLLVAADVAAHGDLAALDESASVNSVRSRLLKGFVVLDLPKGNAIEVLDKVNARSGGRAGSVKLENVPFVSPTTGCGCAGDVLAPAKNELSCAPAVSELIPDDTFFPNQWGLQRIKAPRAWPVSQGDPNVVVAVIDQGVELGHPDLHLWPISYSTITHTNDGSPVGNHGTPCAGIISGMIENSAGVSGLAGKCRVMAIATNFADTEVAEGLYFAADNGARIVSMSFGVYPSWMIWDFALIEAALQYCHERGLVLVAATGNENQNVSRFPATDARTFGIGGSNRNDVRKAVGDGSLEGFWGACFGPDCDVVAPCLEIPSTDRLGNDGYTNTDYTMRFNGTSSATPHVAALAGLVLSINPELGSQDVKRIISETADKINAGPYVYLPTAGKPFGTWTSEVGYGRINAERALLLACATRESCKSSGPCGVDVPVPDTCCVSPCDPPWRPDQQCLYWYDSRLFQVPLRAVNDGVANFANAREFIEFRIIYEHKFCLLGKQHGPLLYTQTLLPGEKLTLYHSDRYRRITSTEQRFSVQTTFMQFLSMVHQARMTNTVDSLRERLTDVKASTSGSFGGGLAGALGFPSGSASAQIHNVDHSTLRVSSVADTFNQSVVQASQLTHAERSVVVSTYEDKEDVNVTARVIHNENECRAVTYFVRKVVELYAMSTRVSDIQYRIVAPNVPQDWRSVRDIDWLPKAVQDLINGALKVLPKIGEVIEQPKPLSLPTDGTVYDPELAHCASCEPERAAAIAIRLEKQKAESMKACLEVKQLELELERRRLLLQRGDLNPFEAAVATGNPSV